MTLRTIRSSIPLLALVSGLSAQTTDWLKLFRQLSDPDPAISARARELSFQHFIPELESEGEPSLARDIVEIAKAFDLEGPVRMQASGLLTGLAERRPDGATALQAVFPTFTMLYHDREPRIRRNAVLAVASLQPRVPPELLPGLVDLVHDSEVGQRAIFGLARSAEYSALAREALLHLLSEQESDAIRMLAVQAIGQVRTAPSDLREAIRKLLRKSDRTVVLTSIKALGQLRPAAVGAREDLRFIAENGDAELSSAAKDALARIDP